MTCSSGIGPIRIGLKFCSPTFSQRSFSLSLLTGWSPASFILRPPLPPSFPIASFGNMSSHAASSLRTASFCNSPTRPKNKSYASDHSTPHFIARKTFSSPRIMYLLLFSFSFHLLLLFSSIYLCLLPSGQMFHVGLNYN